MSDRAPTLERFLAAQPPEWAAVFREIQTVADAVTLMRLFMTANRTIYANDLPIDAFTRDWGVLSQRSMSYWLVDFLHDDRGVACDFGDVYDAAMDDPDPAQTEELRARCRAGGVELTLRATPEDPWNVVREQVRTEADAACFHLLVAQHTANSLHYDPMHGATPPPAPGREPSGDDLSSFIARCRSSGVIVRAR